MTSSVEIWKGARRHFPPKAIRAPILGGAISVKVRPHAPPAKRRVVQVAIESVMNDIWSVIRYEGCRSIEHGERIARDFVVR